MNISRTSWHYRLAKAFDDYPPSDLCSYIRLLAWSAFRMLVVIAIGGLITCFVVCITFAPIVYWLDYVYNFLPQTWHADSEGKVTSFIITAVLGTIFYGCAALVFGVRAVYRYGRRKALEMRYAKPYKEPEPGIFATRWKNFKDKTCTYITYVDDNDPQHLA